MIIAVALEAVTLVAIVTFLLRYHAKQAEAWTRERRELLNRVQRPEVIPVSAGDGFAVPDTAPDEINLVGQIDFDPDAEE